MEYISQYPPEQNNTYVKAAILYGTNDYLPWFATDPLCPLVGIGHYGSWFGPYANCRFHIDLGTAKTITRLYYENYHHQGTMTQYGVVNFTLWGSNSATAFAELTYAVDTDWTQIGGSLQMDIHVSSDVVDPKYITVSNTTAYRYYALKIVDNAQGGNGFRRIELQSESESELEYNTSIINSDFRVRNITYTYSNELNTDFRTKKFNLSNILNSDFRVRLPILNASHILNTVLNWTARYFKINTDFRTKKIASNFINTDLRYLNYEYNLIEASARSSFVVNIDSVPATDLILNSININTTIDTQPSASFSLARNFDNPDFTLDGVFSEITAHNIIDIYFNTVLWFHGEITELGLESEEEKVNVRALGEKNSQPWLESKTPITIVYNGGMSIDFVFQNSKTINLPLTALKSQIGLYDIINTNIDIGNPQTPLEAGEFSGDNGYYKGIKINVGTHRKEIITRGSFVLYSWDEIDEWIPSPNVEYFYVVNATLEDPWLPETTRTLVNAYIGTSLTLSDDLWEIESVTVYWQRKYEVQEWIIGTKITDDGSIDSEGWYYYGTYPYKTITAENGIYESTYKYEDLSSFPKEAEVRESTFGNAPLIEQSGAGLYETKATNYNYVQYCKDVAKAEYRKLDLFKSRAEITMTLDALEFYNIKLLNKINIINTLGVNTFKGKGGFPMSIKGISISSADMKTTIQIDSSKSSLEGLLGVQNVEFVPESPTSYFPLKTEAIPTYAVKLYNLVNPKDGEEVA